MVLLAVILVIIVLTTFIRSRSLLIDMPVMFLAFGIAAFFSVRSGYTKPQPTAFLMVAGILFVVAVSVVVDNVVLAADPWVIIDVGFVNFMSGIMGVICGTLLASRTIPKTLSLSIALVCASIVVVYVASWHRYWFNYIFHDSFTGKTEQPFMPDWYVITESGDTLTCDDYNDKLVLLNFWSTNCGVCFREFPSLERLYRENNHHPGFLLQVVNLPLKRDSAGMAFDLIKKKNKYTFPVVVTDASMWDELQIDGVPLVIILNNNKLVFRGTLELAEQYIQSELKGL